jgi:hypothetical protein
VHLFKAWGFLPLLVELEKAACPHKYRMGIFVGFWRRESRVKFVTIVRSVKSADFGILHTMSCSTRKFIVFDHHLWKFDSLPVELLLIFLLRAD